eukprot:scaffold3353_cov144-Skeletonema_menzelii.AAC.8
MKTEHLSKQKCINRAMRTTMCAALMSYVLIPKDTIRSPDSGDGLHIIVMLKQENKRQESKDTNYYMVCRGEGPDDTIVD